MSPQVTFGKPSKFGDGKFGSGAAFGGGGNTPPATTGQAIGLLLALTKAS